MKLSKLSLNLTKQIYPLKLWKMKVHEAVRQYYAILGISPSHQSNQKYPFSNGVLFGFSSIGSLITSQFLYMFYVASSFMEYMDSMCAIGATAVVFVCFATIVSRKNVLFKSIDGIEKLIDTSESIHNN